MQRMIPTQVYSLACLPNPRQQLCQAFILIHSLQQSLNLKLILAAEEMQTKFATGQW